MIQNDFRTPQQIRSTKCANAKALARNKAKENVKRNIATPLDFCFHIAEGHTHVHGAVALTLALRPKCVPRWFLSR